MINFWASWCTPCRDELPAIVAVYLAHRERGLEVLAVNLTDQERRRDVQRLVDDLGLAFPVLLDERGRARRRYDLVAVPTTVFVDTAGVVRWVHAGPLTSGVLAAGLRTIVGPSPRVTPPSRGDHGAGRSSIRFGGPFMAGR